MADIITGATGTGNVTEVRKKIDMSGGPKSPIVGLSCPVTSRKPKRKQALK